jgi:hypothetical protein
MLRILLTTGLMCLLPGEGLAPDEPDGNALENGDVREILLGERPGTRIRHFRLDAPGAARHDAPVGLLRWVSGPREERAGEPLLYLELELRFPGVHTKLIHAEILRPEERRLVWRELRERSGRTSLVEWSRAQGMRVSESAGGEVQRRSLDASGGALFPLYLLECARLGVLGDGSWIVYEPLSGRLEERIVESAALPAPGLGPLRVLRSRRADGSAAGTFVFAGLELVAFQWQGGGPVARPVSEQAFRSLSGGES